VQSERLIFAEKLPKDEHLSRLRFADLALDTRIVNGHTTTSDALWAGVPVITLQGGHFASRVSSSVLSAIGLPELITHSVEEYETLAVKLANNPVELQEIRQRLARNRLVAPLFDTPRFVRNLESAYKEMWKIFLAGKPPGQIEVLENQTL
jgi:protein O-GlcNAc transferase